MWLIVVGLKVLAQINWKKNKLITCILRDCRKSQKMPILAISHVIKSILYKYLIYEFRVFRQSIYLQSKI